MGRGYISRTRNARIGPQNLLSFNEVAMKYTELNTWALLNRALGLLLYGREYGKEGEEHMDKWIEEFYALNQARHACEIGETYPTETITK